MSEINLILQEMAESQYERFARDGHAFAGNNGPYQYTDTAVRNTAHWLITYAYIWKKLNIEKYKDLCIIFADYLLSEQNKSVSGAIECMSGDNFDHLNGLIGQAWVIESLVYAANTFENDTYYQCALSIYKSQIYDPKTNLWKRTELDGTVVDYDYTCNHQVWFAVAGLMLLDYKYDEQIEKEVEGFLSTFEEKHFRVYGNGLIRHYVDMKRVRKLPFGYHIKRFIKDLCFPLKKINPNKYDSLTQEKGYHLFELYGLARLAEYRKDCSLFSQREFKKALTFGLDIARMNKMFNVEPVLRGYADPKTRMNRFAYGYNSPAFEYPLIQLVFTGESNQTTVNNLLGIQKQLTFDDDTKMLSKNNYDAETLTARLYEYVSFCELVDKQSIRNDRHD